MQTLMQSPNRGVYEQAGKAAEAEIPVKEREIEILRKNLEQASMELNHLRMIAAFGKMGGTQNSTLTTDLLGNNALTTAGMSVNGKKKAPRGQALEHISQVLKPGVKLEAVEIQNALLKEFRQAYGISTIYLNLKRGRDEKKFAQNSQGQWYAL